MYLVYLGDPVFVDHTGFQLFQLLLLLDFCVVLSYSTPVCYSVYASIREPIKYRPLLAFSLY